MVKGAAVGRDNKRIPKDPRFTPCPGLGNLYSINYTEVIFLKGKFSTEAHFLNTSCVNENIVRCDSTCMTKQLV